MSLEHTDPIRTCYPEERQIHVGGEIYTIRPLKIREFPEVSRAFVKVMNRVGKSGDEPDIPALVTSLYDEVIELLDFVTERPDGGSIGDLPMRHMPVFVNTFLEHNVVGDDVLGNWRNLIQNITSILSQVAPGLAQNLQADLNG